jgi:hypothetical protein
MTIDRAILKSGLSITQPDNEPEKGSIVQLAPARNHELIPGELKILGRDLVEISGRSPIPGFVEVVFVRYSIRLVADALPSSLKDVELSVAKRSTRGVR